MSEHRTPCRSRYPSDLSDRQWERVTPFLPIRRAVGRPRTHVVRDVVDAINYRWETGCAWRMLPHDFPPWKTVYTYFRKWQRTGALRQLRDALISRPRKSRRSQSASEWPVEGRGNPEAEKIRNPKFEGNLKSEGQNGA